MVKVITDQDGLYGYGCGTFTQRADLVVPAVDKYLKPFLVGKPADRIDDLWQAMYNSSYWRNGPVLNNAISGVDQALWDIKGRQATCRCTSCWAESSAKPRIATATRAARNIPQVIDSAKQLHGAGFRHVRVQVGVPGHGGLRLRPRQRKVAALHSGPVFEPAAYIRRALRLFEECRKQLGDEVELLHDVHERITPTQAVQFAKDVEKFKLFFFEDPLSPEDIQWFRLIRQQCATPIAMGELFNSPHEWSPLISERLIDYIRVHVSQAGGLTPCRKMAIMGEALRRSNSLARPGRCFASRPCGERRARSGQLQLRYSGILALQRPRCRKCFRGCPVMKDGYLYANEKPGLGNRGERKAAAKYPFGATSAANARS